MGGCERSPWNYHRRAFAPRYPESTLDYEVAGPAGRRLARPIFSDSEADQERPSAGRVPEGRGVVLSLLGVLDPARLTARASVGLGLTRGNRRPHPPTPSASSRRHHPLAPLTRSRIWTWKKSDLKQGGPVKLAGLPIRGRDARRALSASGTLAGHGPNPSWLPVDGVVGEALAAERAEHLRLLDGLRAAVDCYREAEAGFVAEDRKHTEALRSHARHGGELPADDRTASADREARLAALVERVEASAGCWPSTLTGWWPCCASARTTAAGY